MLDLYLEREGEIDLLLQTNLGQTTLMLAIPAGI